MAAGFTCWKCLSRKASQSCMVSQPNTSVLRQDSPPPVSDCLPFTILSCVVTSGRQRLDTCKSGGLRAISCSVRFRGWRPEHLQGSINMFRTLIVWNTGDGWAQVVGTPRIYPPTTFTSHHARSDGSLEIEAISS